MFLGQVGKCIWIQSICISALFPSEDMYVLLFFHQHSVFFSVFVPDSVDILHLLGVGGHPASAFHDQQDWWGRNHHHPLPVLPGTLQSPLPHQLDMEVLLWGILWHDRHRCRGGADHPLLWLLLFVCNKRWVPLLFKILSNIPKRWVLLWNLLYVS